MAVTRPKPQVSMGTLVRIQLPIHTILKILSQLLSSHLEKEPKQNVYIIHNVDIYLESTTPSPCAYNVGGISKTGHYFNSKVPSNKAPLFSPCSNKSVRLIKTPGPGTYDPPGDIADIRMKSSSGFSFGGSERKTIHIRNKACKCFFEFQIQDLEVINCHQNLVIQNILSEIQILYKINFI